METFTQGKSEKRPSKKNAGRDVLFLSSSCCNRQFLISESDISPLPPPSLLLLLNLLSVEMVEQRISRYESNEYNRMSAGFSFSIRGRRGMEARKSVEANDKTTRDDDVRPRDFSNEVASRGRGERERGYRGIRSRWIHKCINENVGHDFFSPPAPHAPLPLGSVCWPGETSRYRKQESAEESARYRHVATT